jgi:hypothetical protein
LFLAACRPQVEDRRKTAGLDEERHCQAKGSFKIQNAGIKDFESDEKNGWRVKTES